MTTRLPHPPQPHPSPGRTRRALATLVVVAAVTLTGCTSGAYSDTALPTPTEPPESTAAPAAPAAPVECEDPLASYAPGEDATEVASGSTMAEIRDRGRLIVGVSADSLLLARAPSGTSTFWPER